MRASRVCSTLSAGFSRAWWGGLRETHSCPIGSIRAIRLCDMRKTYKNGEDLVHGVTMHNWRLWAAQANDEQFALTPAGQGSGLFDRNLGGRLAGFLGVPFRREVWEMPK